MRERANNQGATLVEAVLAIVAIGIAIPPLVGLYRQVAARSVDDTYQRVAVTYAESLMEEIVSKHFEDPGLAVGSFGHLETYRYEYNDVDDFDGLSESPPKRLNGTILNQYGGLTRTVTISNVTTAAPDPASPAADGSTDCKRIRVKVTWTGGKGGELTLSTLRSRACASRDPLDETASAATAAQPSGSTRRITLDLVSLSPCDAVLASFNLSANASNPDLVRLSLEAVDIWTGDDPLPTGTTALNAGTAAERTVAAFDSASPTLEVVFQGPPAGTITYTLVLTFTNGTSSSITFTNAW